MQPWFHVTVQWEQHIHSLYNNASSSSSPLIWVLMSNNDTCYCKRRSLFHLQCVCAMHTRNVVPVEIRDPRAHDHRITDSLRLEKITKITSSNHQPIPTMFTESCPSVLHLHIYWTPPELVTPPTPWAACPGVSFFLKIIFFLIFNLKLP